MNPLALFVAIALTAVASLPVAAAPTCRTLAIMASQCTWLVLDEFGTDARTARRAEHAANSGLIDGCTPGAYQMVLLQGTDITQAVARRLRNMGVTDGRSVEAACTAAAQGPGW